MFFKECASGCEFETYASRVFKSMEGVEMRALAGGSGSKFVRYFLFDRRVGARRGYLRGNITITAPQCQGTPRLRRKFIL